MIGSATSGSIKSIMGCKKVIASLADVSGRRETAAKRLRSLVEAHSLIIDGRIEDEPPKRVQILCNRLMIAIGDFARLDED
jgi:hypothetical protein